MSFLGREASHFPPPERRLRLGFVGGGRGSFIGAVHATVLDYPIDGATL